MRTHQCRQLRPLLTSYIDDEVSDHERLLVEDHLQRCAECRDRGRRDAAVHQALRRWSAEARVDGAPPSWSAGSGTLTQRLVSTPLRVAALATATIAMVFAMSSRWWIDAGGPLIARGQIGDSRCAGDHSHTSAELMNLNRRDCVRRCVEMGAHYIFVSQGVVYTIQNQDFGDLTRFAGQDVQIEGEVRQHVLTVSQVRPLTAGPSVGS